MPIEHALWTFLSITPLTCSLGFSTCFTSWNSQQHHKQRDTIQSLHIIIFLIYFSFLFAQNRSANFRIIFCDWFKLSYGRWQRLVSRLHRNTPPTGPKVFSFNFVDFLPLIFCFFQFLLMNPMNILLHHLSLYCCCYCLLPRLRKFSESNPMIFLFYINTVIILHTFSCTIL